MHYKKPENLNIMRIRLTFFLFLLVITAKSQTYLEYFQQGAEFQQSGEYVKADSLYTLAINDKGQNAYTIYFNRGITRLIMKDTSGHCADMRYLVSVFDKEAIDIYKKNCLKDNSEANIAFEKGVIEYKSNKYDSADSLLSLSVKEFAFVDNVFLRGINRLNLKDTVGFYKDMLSICDLDEKARNNVVKFYDKISSIKRPILPEKIICDYNSHSISVNNRTIDIISNSSDTVYYAKTDYKHFEKAKQTINLFIMQNLRFPVEAALMGKSEKVYVEFIIDIDGTIKYLKVSKGVDPFFKNEVYRLFSKLPPLKPGKIKRKPCLMKFIFPINFNIQ